MNFPQQMISLGLYNLPIGRTGRLDEVARMALVLAGDLASYVPGAAIPING